MRLLCQFAHRFPELAATLLDRDRHKRRNFREETITDVLMAGLVPLEPLGIRVDFPADESKTGEDMDWEFVMLHGPRGGKYIRLHIQAKRAIQSQGKKTPYWYYRELDHAVATKASKGAAAHKAKPNYGTQHKLLIDEAAKIPGCVPLYMFYHAKSALSSVAGSGPAVEGVNWIFADDIPVNVTTSRWPVADRKLEKWRQNFHPLSDLLCFPWWLGLGSYLPRVPTPSEIAARLNERRSSQLSTHRQAVQASDEIPQSTLRALSVSRDGQPIEVERPRVIFIS